MDPDVMRSYLDSSESSDPVDDPRPVPPTVPTDFDYAYHSLPPAGPATFNEYTNDSMPPSDPTTVIGIPEDTHHPGSNLPVHQLVQVSPHPSITCTPTMQNFIGGPDPNNGHPVYWNPNGDETVNPSDIVAPPQPGSYSLPYGPPPPAGITSPPQLTIVLPRKQQRPRPRAITACNQCRLRKSRCSEEKPKCSLCEELDQDCDYPEANHTANDSLAEKMKVILKDEFRVWKGLASDLCPTSPPFILCPFHDSCAGRDDMMEIRSPELLAWVVDRCGVDTERMENQPPAFYRPWNVKLALHRYTQDVVSDTASAIILEVDGILRAQVHHNLRRLKATMLNQLIERTMLAILALHLGKSIGPTIGVLQSFGLHGGRFALTTDGVYRQFMGLNFTRKAAFEFDLQFSNDGGPLGWFPRSRRL